ncbi:putative DNA mismatch repair protein MutS [Paratrimastix pyriformis]|uniref:DNA mismatch repair protein MutS n=1 Tax=Paratrimastix pyriformis TaxID=342808 RepID=A0ABQ8UV48_9EUKA|nr:putative DNA mismatch repair protein MutS [Paratrimastix pyriformis]
MHFLSGLMSKPRASPQYPAKIFGRSDDLEVNELIDELKNLPPMDKDTMRGSCRNETVRMIQFMNDQVGMRLIPGQCFVQGVRAFELEKPLDSFPPEHVFSYGAEGTRQREPVRVVEHPMAEERAESGFHMTAEEVSRWQSTFHVYAAQDVYRGEEGKDLLIRSLQGGSNEGPDAFKMKFALRISENPILCEFDGVPIPRPIGGPLGRVLLVSTCGTDFACRIHDVDDIKTYIRNWPQLCVLRKGQPYAISRDLVLNDIEVPCLPPACNPLACHPLACHPLACHPLACHPPAPSVPWLGGVVLSERGLITLADLDKERFFADILKMAEFRLLVLDRLGVQVMVEVGIGLGVFAGDHMGIGDTVRMLTALALRRALEKHGPALRNIKLVVCALPVFRPNDNIVFYDGVFAGQGNLGPAYSGPIARHSALKLLGPGRPPMPRFVTSELNPGDSHGRPSLILPSPFPIPAPGPLACTAPACTAPACTAPACTAPACTAPVQMNFGPGTEEKLALTTCALLTQHHAVNMHVLDPASYTLCDPTNPNVAPAPAVAAPAPAVAAPAPAVAAPAPAADGQAAPPQREMPVEGG